MDGTELSELIGDHVIDRNGLPVGKLVDVEVDAKTHEPRWGVISFGIRRRRVPVPVALLSQSPMGEVAVGSEKEIIRKAPQIEGPIDPETESRAERHYKLDMV